MAVEFTDTEIDQYCVRLANKIIDSGNKYKNMYPIPMGGYPIALKLKEYLYIPINHKINADTLIIDDLIDSGKTLSKYPNNKAVLFVKNKKEGEVTYFVEEVNDWIIFPWEKTKENNTGIEDHIVRTLEYIGEDPTREGLKDTPRRIVKSWEKIFGGYNKDPKELLRTFDKETYDQMVILKNIEFYSTCEHHFLPFYGKAHIAYIPKKKVIGISKLARLLDVYSRRLQVQERITKQVTSFLMTELNAEGAGCILEGIHFCMTSRGIQKQSSKMVTSSLEGCFREPAVRQEFINLTKGV